MSKKKILTIIGARPQIIKSAAFSRCIQTVYSEYFDEILVHTGQHYDKEMSDLFFNELELNMPAYNLGVGGVIDAIQLSRTLSALAHIIDKEIPDCILVYGDTNSTLAGALIASKFSIPLIHIEAGLRSYDKTMPEEVNRVLTDHLSTLLFCPTHTAIENLKKEGLVSSDTQKASSNYPKIFHCGDIMLDNSLHYSLASDSKSNVLKVLNVRENEYILVTVHRKENVDKPEKLQEILKAFLELAHTQSLPIVWPLHPRTKKAIYATLNVELIDQFFGHKNIKVTQPMGYLDMIALEKNTRLIITDSGGLQKEAYFFKKPCLVLRDNTEWIELVENGNARLCEIESSQILDKANALIFHGDYTYPAFYGDGNAADFICKKIIESL
jgi:UDP-GlcNAc3NAcA epimerase